MILNTIRVAVERAGGLTATANELSCSPVTVWGWIQQGRIPKLSQARKLAKLAKMPVEELRPLSSDNPYALEGIF